MYEPEKIKFEENPKEKIYKEKCKKKKKKLLKEARGMYKIVKERI
jgi:hypothetical protein